MAHTIPTPEVFKARHARFATVADITCGLFLSEAARTVTIAWSETDYGDGIMYLAAHLMVMEGIGGGNAIGIAGGIKKTKAGEVEVEFHGTAGGIGGKAWATYGGTIYGQRYLDLAARNGGQGDAAVVVV